MLTFLIYYPFILWILLLPLLFLRSEIAFRAKAAYAAVLLVCASKFFIFNLSGGRTFIPDLPQTTIWIWNFAFEGFHFLFFAAVIYRLVSVIAALFRKRIPSGAALAVLTAVSWGAAAVGLWNGISAPDVREITFESEAVPEHLDGYRIIHLTDIHVSVAALRWRTEKIVERANAADPDLVVCTGDIVDGLPDQMGHSVEPLRDLRARDGVFFVRGNHELYSRFNLWSPWYTRNGIRFLINECVEPRKGLAVAGIDELLWHARRGKYEETVGGIFDSVDADAFRILLQHRPGKAAVNAAAVHADLQLSGHTHGGIAPPFFSLVAKFNSGFVRGFYDLAGGGRLYVSPGAGVWPGFAMRFFNDDEITLFTLKRVVRAK